MDIEEIRKLVRQSDEGKRFLKKQALDKKKRESAMRIAQGIAPQEEFSATLPNVLPLTENPSHGIPPALASQSEEGLEGTMQMSSPWHQ